MATSKNLKLTFSSLLALILFTQVSMAQSYTVDSPASQMTIEGTSNVHDWEMTAEKFQGNLTAEMEDGQLVHIENLNFTVLAESLKSGKSGMDKNTYKALKTNSNKNITYQMSRVKNIDCTSRAECVVTTTGVLNVAGTDKTVDIPFKVKITGNTITLSGSETLKMTDFGVDPPKAVFGTITTGDQLKINFTTQFSK